MPPDTPSEKNFTSLGKYDVQETECPSSRDSSDVPHTEELRSLGKRPPLELTPAQERKLYRKIDARLISMLALMYMCSFLDRCKLLPMH